MPGGPFVLPRDVRSTHRVLGLFRAGVPSRVGAALGHSSGCRRAVTGRGSRDVVFRFLLPLFSSPHASPPARSRLFASSSRRRSDTLVSLVASPLGSAVEIRPVCSLVLEITWKRARWTPVKVAGSTRVPTCPVRTRVR